MSVCPGFARTRRLKIWVVTSEVSPFELTWLSSVSASPDLPQTNVPPIWAAQLMLDVGMTRTPATRNPMITKAGTALLESLTRLLMCTPLFLAWVLMAAPLLRVGFPLVLCTSGAGGRFWPPNPVL